MRPEISALMRFFYTTPIDDHESVKSYPSIDGLQHNLFFLTHSHPESVNTECQTQSKTNKFEAEIIVELCSYLCKQREQIRPENITVLTMYLGQMIMIRSLLKVHIKSQSYT